MKKQPKKKAAPAKLKHPLSEQEVEFDDNNEPESLELTPQQMSAAVVFNTDWTAETVTTQTSNFTLNPNFQRRDAWSIEKKSRFIESLILGLPVPPIILAEQKGARGKFLVIDGKQRLLSILQFWGVNPESTNNKYSLRGLDVRKDLAGVTFADLSASPQRADDFSGLRNQPIRTVVIRNWPNDDFLHLVFLRFNTGSVKLSAQELRQALLPGEFTKRVDTFASEDPLLRRLLGINRADPRMRDTEILGRHLSFINFLERYPGRLKTFIDGSYTELNLRWDDWSKKIEAQFETFGLALTCLFSVLGEREVARRPDSRLLNKALLDPLLFYFVRDDVRRSVVKHIPAFKRQYEKALADPKLQEAVSLDTASTESTIYRFQRIAEVLNASCGLKLRMPHKSPDGNKKVVLK